MADLVRTVDIDGDAEDQEGASADEEDGPVLAKRKGSLGLFDDLVSEDDAEEGGRGGQDWDFDSHQVMEDSNAVAGAQTGLAAKIKARLEEKAEEDGGEGAGAEATGSKEAKKPRKPAAAAAEVDDSHLRTNICFADLRLSRPLLRAVTDKKFETPTPIQRDVIPPALRGIDVLATAETGSGKTASFLLPALERLCQSTNVRARKRDASGRVIMGPVATKALVLIPTRELAVQCHAMLRDLAKYTMVTYQLVAGGFVDQSGSLRQQPDFVVATPGRMLDHLLNSHSVHMELLEIVIFDEADRLLELGFRNECLQVLQRCSKGRQTMLFSATLNASVEDLAALALVKPVRVHASPVNRVAETLEQEFVKAPSEDLREAVLLSLCARNYTSGVIVFCATRQAAHRLAILFGLCGWRFAEIHGNLPQGDRVKALQAFQQREADFLLATDLAARGLDLCNVETVVNFHLPLDVARYIHRVGRTARMGRAGRAVTVYTPEEYMKVKKLGRQCCSKVKSKVLKRTVAAEAVQQWVSKIKAFEADIEAIRQDESLERELRLADMLSGKSENMQRHKEEIRARPAKTWIMTNKEKKDLKKAEVERVQAVSAETPEVPEAGAGVGAGGKRKKGRKEDPGEDPEERAKRRRKEQLLRRKQAEKAEREQEDRKVRASARRARKKERGHEGAPAAAAKGGPKRRKR